MDHGLDKTVGAVLGEDSLNISDVIAVIETDPDFNQQSNMFSGGSEIPRPHIQPSKFSPNTGAQNKPYVLIREQPASKALRFRYECEGRSAGSIPGVSSTPENKTYPTIQVVGYQGRAMVVVSCVTKDEPYRPHPHNLVGREGCKRGVCTLEIPQDTMTVQFSNLGIQCVKKKDIEEHLKTREEIRVDPFRTGYAHRNQPTTIDLNAVRLCFQVFLEQSYKDKDGNQSIKFTKQLDPVVSDPIYDKKAMSDLTITHLCSCTTTVAGGKDDVIILLCEKVAKEDIQVRFYEEKNGVVVWEGFGEFPPSHVHKQTAIKLRTPRYQKIDVTEPVKVFVQLRRPSDGATSDPRPFMFRPLDPDPIITKRKRPKHDSSSDLLRKFQDQDKCLNLPAFNISNPMDPIKVEPRGTSPYGGQLIYGGLSPNPNPIYVPNESLSPHQNNFLNVGGSPIHGTSPTPDVQYYNLASQNNPHAVGGTSPSPDPQYILPPFVNNIVDTNMPSTSYVCPPSWNIPGPSMPHVNIVNDRGPMNECIENNLYNIDDNHEGLQILNSKDLETIMDANNLSENLLSQCSLGGIKTEEEPISTESLTRLTNTTYNNILSLNDMYKS